MKPLLHKAFSALFFAFVFISTTNAQNCSVNADLDRTICELEQFFFAGSATGLIQSVPTWSQIAGPTAVIVDPNDPLSEVLGMTGGNVYTFRLTATCQDGIDQFQDIDVTVQPISLATASSDLASCPNDTGSIVVNGNAPGNPGETGMWSITGSNDAGVVINFPNSPTTTLTLPETSCGTTTIRWTIRGPDYAPGQFCESFAEIDITNYGGEQPVDAGPDQALDNCYTVSQSTSLNGSYGGCGLNGQQGMWSFVSGPNTPTIADPNSNTTGVSGLIEGTYVFRWSVSGPCANGEDTVTITVDPATQDVTAVGGGNITLCDPAITVATPFLMTFPN